MGEPKDVSVQQGSVQSDPSISVEIVEDGPYRVRGALPLHTQEIVRNEEGRSWSYRQGRAYPVKDGTMLCRCGHSRKKPFCDGSHKTAGVDLAETASFEPMLQEAEEIDGPRYSLTDNERYCAFARFCDNGQRIWNEVRIEGEEHARLAIYMAHQCPAGRLLVWDRSTGNPVEEPLTASLSLIQDPGAGVSGPLVLRGGVRVQSASGESYEVRNRQALCRCGASSNKPFCDGSHASTKFRDGLE
ncbi:CDGSH iron-sulfur domain-containing protein [Roseomonas sp. JC162]|uniref:CDGSH iron-sulfur domain-containing protein n=1 Tax=Neoroseomonas marina TaxID=1232220 RepID=A0A848ELC8_9PROT|nr:CDGSH iron-sulfur domain-containing protein [Neoroseomonas marina]NMJ44158.1 CDGSH iron-sulfur domain-containing protein [Neoroseomonas marina]